MSGKWLCRLSSRWAEPDPGRAALMDLADRPEAEALRVWLAHRALQLVEAQAQALSSRQQGDRKGLDEFQSNAAVLDFIRTMILVLDTQES